MEYIQGNNRSQIVLISSSLEEMIPEDNPVRIIDLFVDSCNLEELGFSNAKLGPEGRPPYHPGDLLKLFIYGYLNRIRSSRCHEYLDALDVADTAETLGLDPDIDKEQIQEKIARLTEKKQQYKKLEQQLIETGQEQISTTDPDSRKLPIHQQILEVCYNIQTSVDDKHNLPIDFKTTNNNDTHALANMAKRTKTIIGHTDFVELADKGYHTGEEIRKCHELGIGTLVAIPKTPISSQAPDPAYNQNKFHYDKENDHYLCPQGHKLTSNGTWYQNHPYKTKHFKTKACKTCPVKSLCTTSPKSRLIERNENIEATQRNKQAIENDKELYKRRQEIVEHPFGTIKR
jgi:hypothetical protein